MHKAMSQQKKKMKNRPVMPRTAGLTSLSKMTEKLTKAGIDPSRIVERAQLIAKARGAERKRKREDDNEMEVDDPKDGSEEDWMDVDDDAQPRKRQKISGGAAQVVPHDKRQPKTDRTTIGMRDATVCFCFNHFCLRILTLCTANIQGDQTAQPGSATTKYACESRRIRSCYPCQDGM
jgi:hypothetical protein